MRKSKNEPEPPRRSVSLLKPKPAKPASKRYSCPAFGINTQNASRSFSTCSSSPPLIKTSTITGPDPLGWKVRHKSANTPTRSHAHRLSLQIPLSDILPDTRSQLSPNSNACTCPKRFRRHNSDSLTFLESSGRNLPVTIEDLSAVGSCPIKGRFNPDDVFEEDTETTEQSVKEPPPVPTKSEMTRQMAQLIAFSRELTLGPSPEVEEYCNTKM